MSGYRDGPASERIHCPVCATPLVELAVGDGRGGGCQSCAGVWVDEAGLGAVRERVFADILAHSSPRTAPARPNVELACPSCRKPMLRTEVATATVDVCPGHGTWFDAGELEQLAHAIAVARNRATFGPVSEPAAPAPSARPPSPETQRVVANLDAQLARSVDRVETIVRMQELERDLRYRDRNWTWPF